MGRNLPLFMSHTRERLQWMATAPYKQNPCLCYTAPSALCLRRAAALTPVNWYFGLYLQGSKSWNGECLQQETVTHWRGCLCAEPLVRLWGSPPTSPGAAPPLGPQRETAVNENMGISIHMWGEEWDKRSVAGAAEEKQSTQQLEVAVRQKKFQRDFEVVFHNMSTLFEKLRRYICYLLGLCLIASYIYRWLPRSMYSVESEEVDKISATQ